MAISFYKYQGTGNDFIIVDNRQLSFPKNNTKLIATMCHRKFGIGADGLILLEDHEKVDFKMVYYNADGEEGSFCGNGARCITHLAKFLNIIETTANFVAADGDHSATIEGDTITLKMSDVRNIKKIMDYVFLDTGSPHHVEMVENLSDFDVKTIGRDIRENVYSEVGANVNFVERVSENHFAVRTYERGVEDETYSCGTGVTAVAIAMAHTGMANSEEININTLGGQLKVTFKPWESGYSDIYLIGPAQQVYKGIWE